ncbi:unnamed protein product [Hymenolepis diminuta]|uniref:Uncharacterized protein n=1 Tax=Hymenolepis diminuta TaxID=6216 RepID=A0A564XX65_HYMDI|nr:unnamed protein product [Hymenolepis diminuta]
MSKRAHRFPPFPLTTSFHLKSTSALMFSRVLTQVTHIKLSLFSTQTMHACQLPASTLPTHPLSSSARLSLSPESILVAVSLNTFLD